MRHPVFRVPRIVGAAVLLAPLAVSALESTDRRMETWTLDDPSAETLVLDDVEGSIRVTGVAGNQVRLVIDKRVEARTRADLEEIERQMPLLVERRPGRIEVVVDAPWRGERGDRKGRHWRNPGRLRYDFTAEIPRDMAVVLRTVNEGEIRMEGVRGSFEVRNVNGGVHLRGLASAGSARTVNGPLTAYFDRAPSTDCDFSSVNGAVDLSFPPDFGADVRVKTLNGEVYTDFDYALSAFTESGEDRRGRRMRRLSRTLRIGGGGPVLSLETVNGDVEIRKNG